MFIPADAAVVVAAAVVATAVAVAVAATAPPLHLHTAQSAHRCTMNSGTSKRVPVLGRILMCSLLAVSGVTSTVSCRKLRPYSGSCSSASTADAV